MFLKPQVALTVTDLDRPDLIQKVVRQVKKIGALPLLELRIDRFKRFNEESILHTIRSFKKAGAPLIATIRSRKEGGGRALSDARRAELFKKVLPLVQILDLELSSTGLRKKLVPLTHRKNKRVILSYHNFRSTPPDPALNVLVRKAKSGGADWVKIAVTPTKKADVGRLLVFTHENRGKNLISIAMGPRGAASRIWALFFGSRMTYSFASRSQAPGQIPIQLLLTQLANIGLS